MNSFNIKEPLFGSWYIDKELGSGAFGTVYKIKREDFGQAYYSALKVIKIPADKNEVSVLRTEGLDEDSITTYYRELVQDLVNEIQILASLKGNSNIVSYEDHLIVPNESGVGYTVFIRMELLKPLNDVLASRGFNENDVIKLGIDVCKALELCEGKNIIHRDIKPDNLFVSDTGDYKLGDFGVARTMEKTVSQMSQKGTNSFMAPEVFLGREYDKTVDIYSLGIVMYMLLNSNRGPFLPDAPKPIRFSDRETATKRRMNGDNIPPLKTSNRKLNDIVLKACTFNPSDRFQSAEEFLNALKALSSSNTKSEYTPPKTNSTPVMDDNDEKTSSPFNTVKTENNKNNANLDDLGDIFEKTSKSEPPSSDDDYCEKTSSPFGTYQPSQEQPEPEPVSEKTKMSNSMQMGLVIAAIAIVVIIAAIFGSGNGNNKKVEPYYSTYNTGITMTDNLFDYQIKVGDTVYQFPMSVEDLLKTGLSYDKPEEADKIVYADSSDCIRFKYSEDCGFLVTVENFSRNGTEVKNCIVTGIDIVTTDDILDVSVAKGIKLGVSTKQDVINAFGEPNRKNHNTDDIFDYFEDEKDYISSVTISFGSKGTILSIDMKNRKKPDNIVEKGASNETPALVKNYKKPISLGNDIMSGIFQLDGDLYKLPVPLSEFLANGWTVTEKDSATIKGGRERFGSYIHATISKGELKLRLMIENFEIYEIPMEKGVVAEVDTSSIKPYGYQGFVFPNDIKYGMSENDFLKAANGVNFTKDQYRYKAENEKVKVSVLISDGKIISIDYEWIPPRTTP